MYTFKHSLFITLLLLCGMSYYSTSAIAAPVKLGIDELEASQFEVLKGKRVGLITNATGVDSELNATIDLMFQSPNVNLVALYAPEHGIRGDVYAGDKVDTYKDSKTGVTVYSIYGKNKKPTPAMLKGVDILVYDIQDIGCRSYTFISTMGLAMQASAEQGIEFMVLDRPNPLGGEKIEGNYVKEGFFSFVSQFPIPYIYGLTCGELAGWLNENYLTTPCNLHVVKMKGWHRSMTWSDTGLQWVPTSPHIPNALNCYYYPMTGILGELGYLNIGVGYTLPFQMVGAPWINADSLAQALNKLELPGLRFRPIYFKPFYSVFKGEKCQGVEIYIIDYKDVNLTATQFIIMEQLAILYPEKATLKNANKERFRMFDQVSGSDYIRKNFTTNHQWSDIEPFFNQDEAAWKESCRPFYLYR